MFIMSKRNIELPSLDGRQRHAVKKGFIGDIPDWAAGTPYFHALVKDGKIVVPASPKDSDIAAAAEESQGTEEPLPDVKPGRKKKGE